MKELLLNSLYRAACFVNLEEILGFCIPSIIWVRVGYPVNVNCNGHFPFSQPFWNLRLGGKWNTFRRFVPLENNSQQKWKIEKGGPVFPVGISEQNFMFHLHVSRSLYQFQVNGRAPRPTGVYDQMEQLFTNQKFHLCSHRNFRFFS